MARAADRRSSLIACGAIALSAIVAAPARAGEPAVVALASGEDLVADARPRPAPLELRVNGAPAGEAIVVIEGGDVWVPVDALRAAGVRGFGGQRRSAAGGESVSLRSLGPALTFQ